MYSTQQYPHPFHNPHHAMHAHGHLEPVMEGLANHGTFVPPAQSQRSAAQFPHNAYPGSLGTAQDSTSQGIVFPAQRTRGVQQGRQEYQGYTQIGQHNPQYQGQSQQAMYPANAYDHTAMQSQQPFPSQFDYPQQTSHRQTTITIPPGTPGGVERFPCEKCTKTFSRAHDRKRHFETHHTSHPPSHPCQFCKKGFSRADSLKRHVDNGCDKDPSITHLP
ncbi:hypothetical protein NLI96_g834 [Meripilus lineatus]|uniref:C2H2-type domain-containing protein n=1 Tax=Meripilus lineatus TaxID=2056292 RepID=A0AAD5YNG3_9APHY|nr:hypothetical protein NLI96_g834 [Physisporinus lineatus]